MEDKSLQQEQDRLLEKLYDDDLKPQERKEIGERLSVLGDPRNGVRLRSDGLPDIAWCYVDVPEDLRGKKIAFYDIQYPGDEGTKYGDFKVKPFYIAKYPTTYVQFQAFLNDPDGFQNDLWWDRVPSEYQKQPRVEPRWHYDNQPCQFLSWYQCVAFTLWLNARLPGEGWPEDVGDDWSIRLPTEWEWQWAAQGGPEKRTYPWGEELNRCFANTHESWLHHALSAGMYPRGAAKCGALDMVGTADEWCLNESQKPKHVAIGGVKCRAMRGGSAVTDMQMMTCGTRFDDAPFCPESGLRLVCAPNPFDSWFLPFTRRL